MPTSRVFAAAAMAVGIIAGDASAHATLEVQSVPANTTYKAVMRIGHGGDGAATHTVRIAVPEGVAEAGQDRHDLASPAPTLVIAAGEADAGHGDHMAAHAAIAVEAAWARETAASARTGGVFLTLVNHTDAPDRLIAGSSEAAAAVALHSHIIDGEVMRMRQVEAVELPAGETVTLEPGGLHIMLIDLKAPLREGSTIPLTLNFERAGEVAVEVRVTDIKHGADGAHGAHDMKHGN